MLEALLNVFTETPRTHLTDVDDMLWVYRRLRTFRNGLPKDIYASSPFKRLVLTAITLVSDRSTPRP